METNTKQQSIAYISTHPGKALRDWLEDVGIKQKDFASTIGIPASRLNELINGKRPMTEDIARKLELSLGMNSAYWMQLQADYEYNERMLSLRNEEQKKSDSQEYTMKAIFNIKELYSRLNITAVSSIVRTRELFQILNANYEKMMERAAIAGCFKHSDTLHIDERNMRTWVLLAQYEADQKKTVGKYTSANDAMKSAEAIAEKANKGILKESDIEIILSNNGISYSVVPKLNGCPVDAYSVMINNRPAIVVTHRHNNMEKLIFDILHELGHIAKHMTDSCIDFINVEYSQENKQESEANAFAADTLIPPDVWNKIMRTPAKNIRPEIVCMGIGKKASQLGINPRIAVARYKHDSKIYEIRAYRPTLIV